MTAVMWQLQCVWSKLSDDKETAYYTVAWHSLKKTAALSSFNQSLKILNYFFTHTEGIYALKIHESLLCYYTDMYGTLQTY